MHKVIIEYYRYINMLNPLEEAKRLEPIVSRGTSRKYSKIERSDSYGGSAKAYCVGCNLPCGEEEGKFKSAKAVAEELEKVAKANGLGCCVLGGGEPSLSWKHVLSVIGLLENSGMKTVVETNGIILGCDESYAKQISKYKVHIKVIFTGSSPEEFSKLTGADPKFFEYQVQAMKNLLKFGVSCNRQLRCQIRNR
jgi:uncharacterized Fe-S cluster-containing radical SAM superfamily protein